MRIAVYIRVPTDNNAMTPGGPRWKDYCLRHDWADVRWLSGTTSGAKQHRVASLDHSAVTQIRSCFGPSLLPAFDGVIPTTASADFSSALAPEISPGTSK